MTVPRVAVVHKTFGNGGAELTCLHTVAALADEFRVTLVTDRDVSPTRISDHFGLDFDPEFEVENYAGSGLFPVLQERTGYGFHHLQTTALERYLAETDFDLYVSTKNELRLPEPAIQYVHFPYVVHKQSLEARGEVTYDWEAESGLKGVYKRLWASLFFDDRILTSPRVTALANSTRTKRITEQVYGTECDVLSPPVQDEFEPPSWEEQESGIVALPGRISPSKRIERLLDVVVALPDHADLHLHVVGAVPETDYAERLVERAPPGVVFEGEVSRDRLVTLLEDHRYGLQVRDENFGIALAEMVYAGCIPLAIDCDPFRELLRTPELIFETATEAADRLATIVADDDYQRSLRDHLGELEQPYRPDSFRSRMYEYARELL